MAERQPKVVTDKDGKPIGILWLGQEEERAMQLKMSQFCTRPIFDNPHAINAAVEVGREINNLMTIITRPRTTSHEFVDRPNEGRPWR